MQKYCIANYKSISFTPFRLIVFYVVRPAWDNWWFHINNLDSVLISCLNPDIFVVLGKPL